MDSTALSQPMEQGDVPANVQYDEKQIVPVVATVLTQLVARNDKMLEQSPQVASNVTVFHAVKPPAITIRKYLERVERYAGCSSQCYIIALVYVDTIIQRKKSFVISSLNIHRLLITSIMLAAKFYDDIYYNNAYYAKIGGVPCNEINNLELEFLFMINFTLNVPLDVFERYKAELAVHANQLGGSQVNTNRHSEHKIVPPQLTVLYPYWLQLMSKARHQSHSALQLCNEAGAERFSR